MARSSYSAPSHTPHTPPGASPEEAHPRPRKIMSAPSLLALRQPASPQRPAAARPHALTPPTSKADKKKVSLKAIAMVRRVIERRDSQGNGAPAASPRQDPLGGPAGPGSPGPEQTGYRDVGSAAGHQGGQALHCSEPSYQIIHVRVLEALLTPDSQDPQGIYVSVRLGDAKQTTTVKPGTWSPKWKEDLLLGCLHPGTVAVEASAARATPPPALEVTVKQFTPGALKANPTIGKVRLSVSGLPHRDTTCVGGQQDDAEPEALWYALGRSPSAAGSAALPEFRPVVRLCVWIEKGYRPKPPSVIGQVAMVLESVTLNSVADRNKGFRKKKIMPCAIVQYGRHWLRMPIDPATGVGCGRELRFDVDEPSSLLYVALFDDQTNKCLGLVRIRVSVLPNNKWYRTTQSLYVRRQSQGISSVIRKKGSIELRLKWSHPQSLTYLKSYARVPAPTQCYTELFKANENRLVKHHNELVSLYLRQHPAAIPRQVSVVVLNERADSFSVSTCRVQIKRFTDAIDTIEAVLDRIHALCQWKSFERSVLANVCWLLFVWYPYEMVQVGLAGAVCWIAKNRVRRSAVVAHALAMDPTLFRTPEDEEPKAAPVGPAETGSEGDLLGDADRLGAVPSGDDAHDDSESDDTDPPVPALGKAQVKRNPVSRIQGKVTDIISGGRKFQWWVGVLASLVERSEALLHWHDGTATFILLALCVLALVALHLLPFAVRPALALAGLHFFRHPRFRDPLPPPPLNFASRLPSRQDQIIPIIAHS